MALDLTSRRDSRARLPGREAGNDTNKLLSWTTLMAACNQSTSRDPIVDYSENHRRHDVEPRDHGLARTVRGDGGQRVRKHRHVLDEAWSLQGASLTVMSVLMFRGAQTVAELAPRTERYSGVGSDGDVETACAGWPNANRHLSSCCLVAPGEHDASDPSRRGDRGARPALRHRCRRATPRVRRASERRVAARGDGRAGASTLEAQLADVAAR